MLRFDAHLTSAFVCTRALTLPPPLPGSEQSVVTLWIALVHKLFMRLTYNVHTDNIYFTFLLCLVTYKFISLILNSGWVRFWLILSLRHYYILNSSSILITQHCIGNRRCSDFWKTYSILLCCRYRWTVHCVFQFRLQFQRYQLHGERYFWSQVSTYPYTHNSLLGFLNKTFT